MMRHGRLGSSSHAGVRTFPIYHLRLGQNSLGTVQKPDKKNSRPDMTESPRKLTAPFSFFEWVLARRYLGATRSGTGVSLISIIAFTGIMLGVAVLIVVMAVMQGFRAKLLDQLLGLNGHVYVESPEPISDYQTLARRLSAIDGVKNAAPVIQAPVYITSRSFEAGAVVVGISQDDLLARGCLARPERGSVREPRQFRHARRHAGFHHDRGWSCLSARRACG